VEFSPRALMLNENPYFARYPKDFTL